MLSQSLAAEDAESQNLYELLAKGGTAYPSSMLATTPAVLSAFSRASMFCIDRDRGLI